MRPMLHHPRRFAQSGFTLVEMAIVLVIIGILLAGVLKGQDLIENARVKEAANIINSTAAAYNAYIDRYRRLPGDDGPIGQLQARGGSWAAVQSAGDIDGVIDATPGDTFSGLGESIIFWHHLRAAGFVKGDLTTGPNALPRHPWGSVVGVTFSATQGRPAQRLLVCMRDVPGKGAAALDRQLDDGLPNTGTLRANQGIGQNPNDTSVNNNLYSEAQNYTICQEI